MARSGVALALTLVAALGGCRTKGTAAGPSPLPPITITQADSVRPRSPLPAAPGDAQAAAERRVTLTAVNTDVRALLLTLAEIAGASLVFGEDVKGRVSVKFDEVPVSVALRTVMDQAGLTVFTGPPAAPWGPTVFYLLPVNVNQASEEMLRARFGVSADLARWMVQNREPR